MGQVCGATIKHRMWQDQPQADLQKFSKPFEISGADIDETAAGAPDEEEQQEEEVEAGEVRVRGCRS